MPPIVLSEAAIVAVANAVQAVCHLAEVQMENQTTEQKAMIAKFNMELLKPWLNVMEWFNKAFEHQLNK